MKHVCFALFLCLTACSGAFSQTASPQPAQLSGQWFKGGYGNQSWLSLRFDHSLTYGTRGCLDVEPQVEAA